MDNLFIINRRPLITFMWDFYNHLKKKEMNRQRLYIYMKVRQKRKKGYICKS